MNPDVASPSHQGAIIHCIELFVMEEYKIRIEKDSLKEEW